jgi:SAM-dependent MidA family methyltransferase
MNANELADAMEIRASIRRKATNRKSVTEGVNDRLADQLEQAAIMLRQQQAEIEHLKELFEKAMRMIEK